MNLTTHSPMFPRNWVGFDTLMSELDRISKAPAQSRNWPPYNIRKVDNTTVIEMAVAGFSESDISVETKYSELIMSGKKTESDNTAEYSYKGIADGSFERTFTLSDSVIVQGAKLQNGMLTVTLERVVPKGMEPRKIAINRG